MQQNGFAFGAECGDGARRVIQDELEVRIPLRAMIHQTEFEVLDAEVGGTHPAQAERRAVAARERCIVPAEEHTVVVRVTDGRVPGLSSGVVRPVDGRPASAVVVTLVRGADRQRDQILGSQTRPTVQDPPPPGRHRGDPPPGT